MINISSQISPCHDTHGTGYPYLGFRVHCMYLLPMNEIL